MVVIEIESPDAFDAIFNSYNGVVLVLFRASNNESGQSWCPDCVAADPYISTAIENHRDTVFLLCSVGPEESYPDHPYRTMPNAKIICVPTLIRYQDKIEVTRLEEGEILNNDSLNQIFS